MAWCCLSIRKYSCMPHNSVTIGDILMQFIGICIGQYDMSGTRMILPTFLASKLCLFDNFYIPHNSVIVRDNFMQFHRNMYSVRTTCRAKEWFFPHS